MCSVNLGRNGDDGWTVAEAEAFDRSSNQPKSTNQSTRRIAEEAGKDLARLMERQLGYACGHVDSIALRLFIRAYWSRVSPLAHAIHDEES